MNKFLLIIVLGLTSTLVGNPGRCKRLTSTDKLLAMFTEGAPCFKLHSTGQVTDSLVKKLIRDGALKGTLLLHSEENEHTTSFFMVKGTRLCRLDAIITGEPSEINLLGSSYPLKTRLTLVRDFNRGVSQ